MFGIWRAGLVVVMACGRLGFEDGRALRDSALGGWDALGADAAFDPGGDAGGSSGVAQFATGLKDACHATAGGVLYCWGSCDNGECGFGDALPRTTPTVVGVETWRALGMGRNHTCGVRTDGTLWCAGSGLVGALGQGNTADQLSLTQVGTASDWIAVTSGRHFNCGLRTPGTLWCWGENDYAQLGVGDTIIRYTPVQVGTDSDWQSLSASGGYHVVARRQDGTFGTWGRNSNGQLGLGDTADRGVPIALGATGFANISVGREHTCGVGSDGSMWCWGYNLVGQLGLGDTNERTVPTRVGGDTDWVEAYPSAASHTCARKTDGSLYCWGYNIHGELGVGDTADRLAPTRVVGSTVWATASAGSDFSCAADHAGGVWCWGQNSSYELGIGDTTDRSVPTRAL